MKPITNYIPKFNLKFLYQNYRNKFLSPVKADGAQFSIIVPPSGSTSSYLFNLALEAAKQAFDIDLSEVAAREKKGNQWVNIYPGEHYKFLAGLIKNMNPKVAIEIGTFLGQASLTIKKFMPANGKLYTFDVIKWDHFKDTCFIKEDFSDGKLVQHLDDLTKMEHVLKHKAILEAADFIFIDALKDGKQEFQFLQNFEQLKLKDNCIVMMDDIRVWNMVKFWHEIKKTKLDVTSFGHWSGSGLIHWNG